MSKQVKTEERRGPPMENRLHYLCRVRLNGTLIFVVWYSGEGDGFVRDEAGRLRVALGL